ncbi:GNAT family N-acetyltransferase [Roseovarius sp. LXJ103]|uniref:GNAT family N-acetyltransferase n=1 Tax=Roseovarius carneus TaxID=2853164 RepID=UPI000D6225B7|nr:GNAT family N-acetyltransferase [Roseovarius carneus]MBZ8117944.1 GNAT family N-acetyltransferase [Roseovarius carneus]PWE36302.1 GNAT family N-acetyltransferase [Pelagicola sp. LXJ1103]
MITVEKPNALDAGPMANLLNAIIKEGGTTAHTKSLTAADMTEMMAFAPAQSAWHIARDTAGHLVGFQFIEPLKTLPPEACDIATFVQMGRTGLGIGSALFTATARAAKAMGYVWINANIRADNEGGLIYYQSRGFRDYGRIDGMTLASGLTVDKILKRYDI